MQPRARALLQLHLSVFLFGFTAILGKLILLPGLSLIWWRTLLAVLGFWLLLWRKQGNIKLPPLRSLGMPLLAGVILMVHWLCFFGAIRLSNASITLVCLSSATLFTATLDPLFRRSRPKGYEIVLGLVIIAGIVLIAQVQVGYGLGILVGLLSALTSALYGIVNKRLAEKYPIGLLNTVEMTAGWLSVCLVLPLYLWLDPTASFWPTDTDWVWLLLLAFVCTNYAYNLSLSALRHLPTFAYMLAVNLEPVYGVLMAFVFFQENKDLHTGFYIGSALVLAAVLSYPMLHRRFEGQL
jgi:drug/metabolite transporter (DMT)-like permease